MRIFIVGSTYYPGNNGQAIFTIHLAEGLARRGHEVHAIVPNDHYRYEREEINGVTVHKMQSVCFNWVHPGACLSLFNIGRMERIFREFSPDVVHLQDHYFLSREATIIAHRRKVPMVGTNHFLPENVTPYLRVLPMPLRWKIGLMWKLMLWTYNTLDAVTTPTETAAKILRGTGIHVAVNPISCGVDTDHFVPPAPDMDRAAACKSFGLDPSATTFLYVGRLDREKRVDLLLRGLARVVKNGRRDIHLAVAGQGAGRGELEALTRSLGLEPYVHFLGYVPNEQLPLLYRTAHIFAMPSPEELQSIASLEAMASGRPVLAANARALPELVTTGGNGYLFTPGQPEDVARGMVYLVEHRTDWERMGRASRARAVEHSLASTIRKYEEVYCRASGLEPTEAAQAAEAGEPKELERELAG